MKIPEILIVETVHQPGSLAKVLQVIADAGLTIEHLTALRRDQGRTSWEITLEMDEAADRSLYDRIGQLPTARFLGKSDRVFNRHRGGKIRTVASIPINTLQVLRDIYTPGVARVCLAIEEDPRAAHDFTSLDSTVAIVTNGTAVLGLGNIGALAGLPVMEGKAALFADLVGISGVPILLKETQPDRVVEAIVAIEMSQSGQSLGFPAFQSGQRVIFRGVFALQVSDDPHEGCVLFTRPLRRPDEAVVLELARTTLENYGYRVVTATNGFQGVARFEEQRNEIKLLLTDNDMPVMDGISAIQTIQRLRRGIPIVMASGTRRDEERLKTIDVTNLVNLGKPYTAEELLNAVSRAMRSSTRSPPIPTSKKLRCSAMRPSCPKARISRV